MAPDTYLCPTCDHEVIVGKSCRSCRKTPQKKKKKKQTPRKSWEQDSSNDGLDLPNENFDYDEFLEREFGKAPPHRQIGIALHWWIVAIILLVTWAVIYL